MSTRSSFPQIPFRLQWTAAAMLAGLLTRATHPRTLLLAGLLFGLAQWWALAPALRPHGRLAHLLWLPASALGGIAGYLLIASWGVRLLGPVLVEHTAPYHNVFSHLIFVTFLWGVIGLAQWPLLRGSLPRAGRWIPASAGGGLAWSLADLALQAAGIEMHTSLLAGLLSGGAYGWVTGRLIAPPEESSPPVI